MKKRMFRAVTCLALLCVIFVLPATAAAFSDVSPNAWYAPAVEAAVDAGILQGRGDGTFDPEGSVTGAELLAIAVRLDGGTVETADGEAWYAPYVRYAAEHGLTAGAEDFSAAEPVTRRQMAVVLYNVLSQMDPAVTVDAGTVPDVADDDPALAQILSLYRWGILTGDAAGAFYPDSGLTRAELAQVLYRIVDEGQRVTQADNVVGPFDPGADFYALPDEIRAQFVLAEENVEGIKGIVRYSSADVDIEVYLDMFPDQPDYAFMRAITLKTDAYATARGLRVGDTEEKYLALYGERDPATDTTWVHVTVKDGVVTEITVYTPV